MAPVQPPSENPRTPGHPLLRQFLITVGQFALPLAEAFLTQWLASKGIKLPPVGGSNANGFGDSVNVPVGGGLPGK